ncbi:MAG: PASTA domain-containing protein, partial [Actinomycetia bacterium]|nr:PASTA domain-containing protein [Actinomycetes bacterium]
LTTNNLQLGVVTQAASETVEAGKVISTDPQPNVMVELNSRVNLVISTGSGLPAQVQVPNIVGQDPEVAKQDLTSRGLDYRYEGDKNSDTVAAGLICQQSPDPNTLVDSGTPVSYWISKGPETATVPNVVNLSSDEAERQIFNSGFVAIISTTTVNSSTVPKDYVVSQTPAGNSTAPKGSNVTIVLSAGPVPPEQVPIPNVTGKTLEEATLALQNVGLKFTYTYVETPDPTEVGLVYGTNPPAGTKVDVGSTVEVTIFKAEPTSPATTP